MTLLLIHWAHSARSDFFELPALLRSDKLGIQFLAVFLEDQLMDTLWLRRLHESCFDIFNVQLGQALLDLAIPRVNVDFVLFIYDWPVRVKESAADTFFVHCPSLSLDLVVNKPAGARREEHNGQSVLGLRSPVIVHTTTRQSMNATPRHDLVREGTLCWASLD